MRRQGQPLRRLVRVFAATAVVILTSGYTQSEVAEDRVVATRAVYEYVEGLKRDEKSRTMDIRVHLFNKILNGGSAVLSASVTDNKVEPLVCETTCLFFFVDKYPRAHFAHPVEYVLYELEPDATKTESNLKSTEADWWPEIRAPGQLNRAGEQIFDTVASRSTLAEIVARTGGLAASERDGTVAFELRSTKRSIGGSLHGRLKAVGDDSPGKKSGQKSSATSEKMSGLTAADTGTRSVWAVILNGGLDASDTFDEDADGMFALLIGHDVPNDHIFYLSPHHGEEPCPMGEGYEEDLGSWGIPSDEIENKICTTFSNVEKVMTETVPDRINDGGIECDHFVFFNSSHGKPQELICVASKTGIGGMIGNVLLKDWIAGINCKKITMIIEACHSSDVLSQLQERPEGNPEQVREIFTSTSMGEDVSFGDDDALVDPNPGDVGSESTWGYIEAYATGSADGILGEVPDKGVSFAEAAKYAMENHAKGIEDADYLPGVYPPLDEVSTPTVPERWCYNDTGEVDLEGRSQRRCLPPPCRLERPTELDLVLFPSTTGFSAVLLK